MMGFNRSGALTCQIFLESLAIFSQIVEQTGQFGNIGKTEWLGEIPSLVRYISQMLG